ncbi:hypothetical protein O5813_16310 [Escherichia coli]|nr:hypothetical protein [Escherichia coli]
MYSLVALKKIRLRAMKYNAPFSWVDKKYPDAYKNRKPIINKIIPILSNYTVDMQEWDIDAFKQLNWKKKLYLIQCGVPRIINSQHRTITHLVKNKYQLAFALNKNLATPE